MIFPFIWRILPGPRWLKVLEALLLFGAVAAGLFVFAFPFVENFFIAPPTIYH